MKRYSKLLDPETLNFEEVYKPDRQDIKITSRSLNKEFFYFLGIGASVLIIFSILLIGNLTGDAGDSFNKILEAIPFLELKLSRELVEELQFPSPVTNTVFIANFLFLSLIVVDMLQKESPSSLKFLKSYDNKGRVKLEYSSKDLFKESSAASYIIHLLVLLFMITSILVSWTPKPKVNVTKIEFIPSQIPAKKKVKTHRRAKKNSIDQGKHNPKKPVRAPDKTPGKPKMPPAKKAPPQKPKPAPKPQPKAQPKPKPRKPVAKPRPTRPKPRPKAAPKPKILKEAINPVAQTPTARPLPKLMDYAQSNNSSSASPKAVPAPKASSRSGRGSGIISTLSNIPRAPDLISSTGQGGGAGTAGNPAPNQYASRAPSIAANEDINFGPYMAALQRKIKRAWKPPRGTESNRIIVTFTIDTQGKLVDLKLASPSGNPEANLAALEAVNRAAPFDILPKGSAPTVDIEFTFDYNVFQKSRW